MPAKAAGVDWREATLERARTLIKQAVPDVVEEIKWRKPSNGMKGVPVWSRGGILCTGETYEDKVKFTFMQGAALPDPKKLFNSSLEGGTRRAFDVFEGDAIDAAGFKALVRAAAQFNAAKGTLKGTAARR
jgi:hypothetical protein